MKGTSGSSTTGNVVRHLSWVLPVVVSFLLLAFFHTQGPGPGTLPVSYRIGSVDERFGLTRQEVAEAVEQAASIWENACGRDVFCELSDGQVEINLVYDYRQETSDKLKGIGGRIDNTRGSYDALNAHIDQLQAEYRQVQADLSADIASYNEHVEAFHVRSAQAMRLESSSGDISQELDIERTTLEEMRDDLQSRQEELKAMAETLKGMVAVANEIANNLNIRLRDYNSTGKDLGREFSEGCYERRNGTQGITVFHFSDRTKLVRVLAHEMGHALGMKHVDNPEAIMYRLNQSDSLDPAPEDIAALHQALGITDTGQPTSMAVRSPSH